jgi:hypothetical protein
MVDFDKVNRLRKLRDEIDKMIDEELYKCDPVPFTPIQPTYPWQYTPRPFESGTGIPLPVDPYIVWY